MHLEPVSQADTNADAGDTAPSPRPVVWTIAGTDSGGGAGIQADTRAFDAFGVHGACAVAGITAQHSRSVMHVEPVSPTLLDAQLAALAEDMPPDAIKTGLLGSVENLRVVVNWVRKLRARCPHRPVPLVVDPVFGATTGALFANGALRIAYRNELLPLATLATPNVAEARALVAQSHALEAPALARAWRTFGPRAVVVTGGDVDEPSAHELELLSGRRRAGAPDARATQARDWLDSDHVLPAHGWVGLPRLAAPHHHGTGCVFASAAAAALARGFVAADAVVLAKMATTEALRHGYAAGAGAGPVAPRAGFALRAANLPTLVGDRGRAPAEPAASAFAAMPESARGLYAIVDSAAWVARVVAAGVKLVQLRIKAAAPRVLVDEIRASIAYAQEAGATLIVNDHWALALELGADGVHLGQEDLDGVDIEALRRARLLLGISTHAYWEVCRARALRPSYVACGPIHATTLKKMPWRPQGDANLAYWCRLLADVPVVAIGGMDAPRARDAMRAGASAVAVVGAITRAESPETAIAQLRWAIEAGASEAKAGAAAQVAFARPTLSEVSPTAG